MVLSLSRYPSLSSEFRRRNSKLPSLSSSSSRLASVVSCDETMEGSRWVRRNHIESERSVQGSEWDGENYISFFSLGIGRTGFLSNLWRYVLAPSMHSPGSDLSSFVHQILFAIFFCPSNKTASEMYIRIRAFGIYRHRGVSLKVCLKADKERKAFRS